MTTIINTKPPEHWLRELASARTAYEERLGWPVAMEVSTRRLVVRVGHDLGAVTMPASLGRRVLAALGSRGGIGPVLAADGWWTFLTGPAPHDMPATLGAAGMRDVRRGASVTLPWALTDPDWVAAPTHTPPPWSTVVTAASRVLA